MDLFLVLGVDLTAYISQLATPAGGVAASVVVATAVTAALLVRKRRATQKTNTARPAAHPAASPNAPLPITRSTPAQPTPGDQTQLPAAAAPQLLEEIAHSAPAKPASRLLLPAVVPHEAASRPVLTEPPAPTPMPRVAAVPVLPAAVPGGHDPVPAAGLPRPAAPPMAPAMAITPVANELLFVNYSLAAAASLAQVEPLHFPYVVLPPRTGGVVKLPQTGRVGRRGHTEAAFLIHLRQYFGAAFGLHENHRLLVPGAAQPYEPDFTLHDKTSGLNLLLDVEIDEPYAGTNDPATRLPLHYQGADTNRNNAFRNRGWVVVRFAEIQVHQHPEACCRFLAEVVAHLNPAFTQPSGLHTVPPLPPVPQWTQAQAQAWSRSCYREAYLGLGPSGFGETAAEPWIAAVEEDARGQQSEALVRDEPLVRTAKPVVSTAPLAEKAEILTKPAVASRRAHGSFTRPILNPQIPCPVCRLGIMLRGKTAYGCSRFRIDCQFRVPFEWRGRSLSDKDLMTLMHNGQTAVLGGFINSKTGKKYNAALKVEYGQVMPVFDAGWEPPS